MKLSIPSKFDQRALKIAIAAVALASIAEPAAKAIVQDYVTLTFSPAVGYTGILNLKDNDLIVRTGSLATITGYIQTGLYNGAGGYWDGPGINSSNAAAESATLNTAVGVIDNSQVGYTNWPVNGATGLPQPDAHAVSAVAILAKYTYFGDADLNGIIDITDYGQIDTAAGGGGGTGWLNGDFDYSGGPGGDISDYGLIDTSFLIYTSGGLVLASQGSGASIQGVPEPGSLGLLACGVLGLAMRRRSKK